MDYDAVIIGGGACGLMCAVQMGFLGKRSLILEKNNQVGAKILISGGGRCNYTNLYTSSANFLSDNEHFCKSALSQWTVENTISFFEIHGIYGQEKTLGQLFPIDKKAKDVVLVFKRLCIQLGQTIFCNTTVKSIAKVNDGSFRVSYEQAGENNTIQVPKVIVTSGGLSIPKMGASDFAFQVARQFDLKITKLVPALVPLTITGRDADWYAKLAGNTVFCRVSNKEISFEEQLLFTHWGLSGPAILQLSSYWEPGQTIEIDLLPHQNIREIILAERDLHGKKLLFGFLANLYTKKFAEALGKFLPINKQLASLTKAEIQYIFQLIHHFNVKPAGSKGYDKAEVMKGGIATDELFSKTLESKKISGLYFGGECVDVTGWLGGYNFQWAWASAYVIAQHI
ncbi:MAG: NAD(P)/FAD-dependent oxidoreductase [Sphingobacteriaceae bacterium]